jgi:hypothetical protein
MRILPNVLSSLVLLWLLAVSGASAAGPFSPHRAVYEVKVTKSQAGSSIVSGGGVMTIQIEKSCDGWITGQTWRMVMNTFDGKSFKHDIRYATWESFDGLNYRFSVNDKSDRKQMSFKGKATLKSVPGTGKAYYQQPKKMTANLPDNTVFPISHVRKLIQKAKDGVRLAPYILFDGASVKGPLRVTTFISNKKSSGSIKRPIKHKLLNVGGWGMRMAFYPSKGRAAEPDYELDVIQLENGIVPTAMQVFQDFTINMTLKKLEGLKPFKCS